MGRSWNKELAWSEEKLDLASYKCDSLLRNSDSTLIGLLVWKSLANLSLIGLRTWSDWRRQRARKVSGLLALVKIVWLDLWIASLAYYANSRISSVLVFSIRIIFDSVGDAWNCKNSWWYSVSKCWSFSFFLITGKMGRDRYTGASDYWFVRFPKEERGDVWGSIVQEIFLKRMLCIKAIRLVD